MQIFVLNDFTFDQTEEFQNLAGYFRREISPYAVWHRYDTPEEMAIALRARIMAVDMEPILVLRAAAYMLTREGIQAMLTALDTNPDLACILPVSGGSTDLPFVPEYYTIHGFRGVALRCSQLESTLTEWRGEGDPGVYVCVPARLRDVDLDADVMTWPQQLGERSRVCINCYMVSFYDIYKQERQDVFEYLPTNLRSLLDIGCSQGYFGAAVKRRLGIRVVGAEINPVEATKARHCLDEVWQGDILTMDVDEHFDCITCLDVLEHFSHPQRLLVSLQRWLRPDSRLVLTVPNIGHWSIIEALLAGHWEYSPVGIQCETHARFYTRDSLTRLLEDCGYAIERIGFAPVSMPPQFASAVESLIKSGMEVDVDSLNRTGFYVSCRLKGRH